MFNNAEMDAAIAAGFRRSDLTKQKILKAAEEEFAEKGLYGTRVDEIASRAGVNKRMMYVYFGNKEELYAIILKEVFSALSSHTREIRGITSVEELVREYCRFLSANPHFVKLAMWENMNDSKYFKISGAASAAREYLSVLSSLISEKSAHTGEDVDCGRLAATINAMCLSTYSNIHNMSCLLDCDLTTEDELNRQAEYVCRIVGAYIR